MRRSLGAVVRAPSDAYMANLTRNFKSTSGQHAAQAISDISGRIVKSPGILPRITKSRIDNASRGRQNPSIPSNPDPWLPPANIRSSKSSPARKTPSSSSARAAGRSSTRRSLKTWRSKRWMRCNTASGMTPTKSSSYLGRLARRWARSIYPPNDDPGILGRRHRRQNRDTPQQPIPQQHQPG